MSQQHKIEIYRLDVSSGGFTRVDTIITYRGLSWVNEMLTGDGGSTRISQCKFDLDIRDPKATKSNFLPYVNHVAVKRNDTVVWFGPIVDVRLDISGSGSAMQTKLDITAKGPSHHLTNRYTEFDEIRSYEGAQRANGIAWDLINYTQSLTNGNLGISKGSVDTTDTEDVELEFSSNIFNAIENAAAGINGFDYEFVPVVSSGLVTGVNFNAYSPRLSNERNDIPPILVSDKEGAVSNAYNLKMRINDAIYNYGIGVGAGTGDEAPKVPLSFGASQASYTRRENIYPYKSIELADTLLRLVRANLNKQSTLNWDTDVTLREGRINYNNISLGDIVTFKADYGNIDGYANFTRKGRITAIAVDVGDAGDETVTPTINLFS